MNKHLLIVDDEEHIRRSLAYLFRASGYQVTMAQSGQEALRALEEAEQPVDLVLTDLGMPEMDGLELITRLRAQGQRMPVVVISGYLSSEMDQKLRMLDCLALVEKPFNPADLVTRVGEWLQDGGGPNQ